MVNRDGVISWKLEAFIYNQILILNIHVITICLFLGLFQYWFQNRRAKARKEGRKLTPTYQPSPSNQFGRPSSRVMPCERTQFLIQSVSDHWKRAERMSFPALENKLEEKPRSQPIKADYHYSSFKSNQFRMRSSFMVPMFHPDQFKRRPSEPARLSYSRNLLRYQPY